MKRTLRQGDYVKTADGAVLRVRFVGPKYDPALEGRGGYTEEIYAELVADDNKVLITEEGIYLPVTELKRITDPNKKRPPIEGMPETRPRCPNCDKPLGPLVEEYRGDQKKFAPGADYTKPITRREFKGWRGYPIVRGGDEKFCTLNCAYEFARLAFKAGYRIKR